jgi:hypothetical protein
VSARTDIAEHLTEVLPDTMTVIDHDADPVIAKTTVMVWAQTVEHSAANLGHWRWVMTIVVMIPKQVLGDDDLEGALEEVLEALDLWDYPLVWQSAEYSVYAERYPAYKITAEMFTKREYPGDAPAPEPEPAPETPEEE